MKKSRPRRAYKNTWKKQQVIGNVWKFNHWNIKLIILPSSFSPSPAIFPPSKRDRSQRYICGERQAASNGVSTNGVSTPLYYTRGAKHVRTRLVGGKQRGTKSRPIPRDGPTRPARRAGRANELKRLFKLVQRWFTTLVPSLRRRPARDGRFSAARAADTAEGCDPFPETPLFPSLRRLLNLTTGVRFLLDFQGSTFLFFLLRFPVIVPRFFPVKYNIDVIYIVHEPMEQRASTESSSPSFVYAPRTHERNTQGTRTPRRREARRRSHNYAHPLELHSFIKVSEHGEREGEREGETCAAPC